MVDNISQVTFLPSGDIYEHIQRFIQEAIFSQMPTFLSKWVSSLEDEMINDPVECDKCDTYTPIVSNFSVLQYSHSGLILFSQPFLYSDKFSSSNVFDYCVLIWQQHTSTPPFCSCVFSRENHIPFSSSNCEQQYSYSRRTR